MMIPISHSYMAVVQRVAGGFCAFFPNLPTCSASGGNLEQLRANAEGAVFDYLQLSGTMRARMVAAIANALPPAHGVARMFIQPKGH